MEDFISFIPGNPSSRGHALGRVYSSYNSLRALLGAPTYDERTHIDPEGEVGWNLAAYLDDGTRISVCVWSHKRVGLASGLWSLWVSDPRYVNTVSIALSEPDLRPT